MRPSGPAVAITELVIATQDRTHQEAAYLEAIEAQRHDSQRWHDYGRFLHLSDRPQEAQRAYKRALELKPERLDTLNNLALLAHDSSEPERAIALYERTAKTRPLGRAMTPLELRLTSVAHCAANTLRAQKPSTPPREAVRLLREVIEVELEDPLVQRWKAQAAYELAGLSNGVVDEAPQQYVEDLFDLYAEFFDTHLLERLRYRTPQLLAALLVERVPRTCRWLDLGCGTGLMAEALQAQGLQGSWEGVDLSSQMIAQARSRGVYEALHIAPMETFLGNIQRPFELLTAADVFVYVGNLKGVFEAAFEALRPGGIFAFSTECHEGAQPFQLHPSLRFSHSRAYLQTLASDVGFAWAHAESAVLRFEREKPCRGDLVILSRPS